MRPRDPWTVECWSLINCLIKSASGAAARVRVQCGASARPDTMPARALSLALLLATAHAFKITSFHVPSHVNWDMASVEIECSYEGNFTILNWFKGPTEFFRYKPASTPSTRSFPILGVGTIDLISCGPNECRLRLGKLTEEASGLYRCDLELDKPPYKFETRTGYMNVYRQQRRKPVVEGLAEEYDEGDEIQAYCRSVTHPEIRWYVNGQEVKELRGSATFKMDSKRINSQITLPTVTVQCAEMLDGKLLGSNEVQAKWKRTVQNLAQASENSNQSCAENNSNSNKKQSHYSLLIFALISISACVLRV